MRLCIGPQATDDSMKGGLTTTIEDLKQLLLGTLLWSPLTFMQVGTHHLVSGEPIVPDPGHSAKGIAGIRLSQEQEDVLIIIGGEAQIEFGGSSWPLTSCRMSAWHTMPAACARVAHPANGQPVTPASGTYAV